MAHGRSGGARKRLAHLRMIPFARMLADLVGGPAVFMLRYRYRGRNTRRWTRCAAPATGT